VTIVGQSLGGLTAIALAAARPDLVARLVLVDVLPFIRGPEQVSSFLAGPESFSSRAAIVTRARAFGFGRSDAAVARGVWHNTRRRARAARRGVPRRLTRAGRLPRQVLPAGRLRPA
jgi:pimeloyl-ACP methyl ester carboxylesterase